MKGKSSLSQKHFNIALKGAADMHDAYEEFSNVCAKDDQESGRHALYLGAVIAEAIGCLFEHTSPDSIGKYVSETFNNLQEEYYLNISEEHQNQGKNHEE